MQRKLNPLTNAPPRPANPNFNPLPNRLDAAPPLPPVTKPAPPPAASEEPVLTAGAPAVSFADPVSSSAPATEPLPPRCQPHFAVDHHNRSKDQIKRRAELFAALRKAVPLAEGRSDEALVNVLQPYALLNLRDDVCRPQAAGSWEAQVLAAWPDAAAKFWKPVQGASLPKRSAGDEGSSGQPQKRQNAKHWPTLTKPVHLLAATPTGAPAPPRRAAATPTGRSAPRRPPRSPPPPPPPPVP